MNKVSQIKELKKEVSEIGKRLEKTLGKEGKEAAKGISSFVAGISDNVTTEALQEAAQRAGENVRAFIKEKQEKAKEVRDDYENIVQDHPIKSTLIAFAGGLLIGALLKKRD